MNEDTGEIVPMDDVAKLTDDKRKRFVEIPADELPAVQAMNRHDRRAWAAQQRRARQKH